MPTEGSVIYWGECAGCPDGFFFQSEVLRYKSGRMGSNPDPSYKGQANRLCLESGAPRGQ